MALQLNLYQGQAVDKDNDIVALAAVGGIDGELVHDFIVVLAPVTQIYETIIEGSAIIAVKGLLLTQAFRRGKHVGRYIFLKEFAKFIVRERDEIEPFELLTEVPFERV